MAPYSVPNCDNDIVLGVRSCHCAILRSAHEYLISPHRWMKADPFLFVHLSSTTCGGFRHQIRPTSNAHSSCTLDRPQQRRLTNCKHPCDFTHLKPLRLTTILLRLCWWHRLPITAVQQLFSHSKVDVILIDGLLPTFIARIFVIWLIPTWLHGIKQLTVNYDYCPMKKWS